MEILPNCIGVKTILPLFHEESNKMPAEKARWKLHKNAACCFKQILEAASHKTAVL